MFESEMFETVIFNSSIALTWILFMAIFPIIFFWWRKAYRIFVKKDYTDVCVKKGVAPANPKKWGIVTGVVNVVAGLFALLVLVKVLLLTYYNQDINFIADNFSIWSEFTGQTILIKIVFEFFLKRWAHPNPLKFGRKKKKAMATA